MSSEITRAGEAFTTGEGAKLVEELMDAGIVHRRGRKAVESALRLAFARGGEAGTEIAIGIIGPPPKLLEQPSKWWKWW